MLAVRSLLAQRHFAALLCAATLLLKLLVPTGYMIGNEHGRMTIELCSGVVEVPVAMAMAMPGMHGDLAGHGKLPDYGKTEMPCAFVGLSAVSLGAVDPVQLAALIAFLFVVGLSPAVLPAIIRRCYLRPPLRGPPLTF